MDIWAENVNGTRTIMGQSFRSEAPIFECTIDPFPTSPDWCLLIRKRGERQTLVVTIKYVWLQRDPQYYLENRIQEILEMLDKAHQKARLG